MCTTLHLTSTMCVTQWHSTCFTQWQSTCFTQWHSTCFTHWHSTCFTQWHSTCFTQWHSTCTTQHLISTMCFTQWHSHITTFVYPISLESPDYTISIIYNTFVAEGLLYDVLLAARFKFYMIDLMYDKPPLDVRQATIRCTTNHHYMYDVLTDIRRTTNQD